MYVYKFISKDKIVYIGKTINIIKRLSGHEIKSKLKDGYSIEYINFDNDVLGSIMELYLINKYKPKLNSNSKHDNIFYLKELDYYDKDWVNISSINNINYYSSNCSSNIDFDETREYIKNNYDFSFLNNNIKINKNHKDYNSNPHALSIEYFKNNKKEINVLINNIRNFFNNYSSSKSKKKNFYSCEEVFNGLFIDKIKGTWRNLNTNIKVTNVSSLAVIGNLFSSVKSSLDSKEYALINLLNLLKLHSPDKNNKILLYIPSKRMRELLEDFLNGELK